VSSASSIRTRALARSCASSAARRGSNTTSGDLFGNDRERGLTRAPERDELRSRRGVAEVDADVITIATDERALYLRVNVQ
jgi:hypothetical protein